MRPMWCVAFGWSTPAGRWSTRIARRSFSTLHLWIGADRRRSLPVHVPALIMAGATYLLLPSRLRTVARRSPLFTEASVRSILGFVSVSARRRLTHERHQFPLIESPVEADHKTNPQAASEQSPITRNAAPAERRRWQLRQSGSLGAQSASVASARQGCIFQHSLYDLLKVRHLSAINFINNQSTG